MTDPANVQDSIWSGTVVEEYNAPRLSEERAWYSSFSHDGTPYVEDAWPDYDVEPIWNQMQRENDPIYQDDSDPDYTLTGSIDDIEIDWGSDDDSA